MRRRVHWSGRLVLPALTVLVLAAASTVAAAAATGVFSHHRAPVVAESSCSVPSLPGTTVTVALSDMGGGMMGGRAGPMRQGNWPAFRRGMMSLTATPASVPHGRVSLRAANVGVLSHELVVLPLPDGQAPGSRSPGTDGTVDESGSLGEASADCAAGAGEGIPAGSSGWITLELPVGHYELLCNQPGHYTAGMYAELDVT